MIFGLVFGFVGLMCDMVGGAIRFNPSSNLAPIIGVIVTGPGGVLVGLVVGFWAGYRRARGPAFLGTLAIGSVLVGVASLALGSLK